MFTEPCPSCGRNVPRLGSDISRSGKDKLFSLTKLKGTLVDQGAYYTVIADNPSVREWQVEIGKAGGDPFDMDTLDVYVALEEGADETRVRQEIDSGLLTATEVKPNKVEFMPLEKLVERLGASGGMKELHVIDTRSEGGAGTGGEAT